MTSDISATLMADYGCALSDGDWPAHDHIVRSLLRRGLASDVEQAKRFAEYAQNLAARIRAERELDDPKCMQPGPYRRKKAGPRKPARKRRLMDDVARGKPQF